MRVGVRIRSSGCLGHPAGVRLAAMAAEQVGYVSLWAVDRGILADARRPTVALDAVGALAVAAAGTSRIRLGTSVPVRGCRPPLPLVRALTGPDHPTQERLALAFDVDDSPGAHAGVDAGLLAVKAARGEQRRPPVLLTTYSRRGLEHVAQGADGWSPMGLPLEVLLPMWHEVRDLAGREGRDPDVLELVVGAEIKLSDRAVTRDREPYCGTIEQVVDDVDQTLRAGADEVVLGVHGDPTLDEALEVVAGVAEALELRAGTR